MDWLRVCSVTLCMLAAIACRRGEDTAAASAPAATPNANPSPAAASVAGGSPDASPEPVAANPAPAGSTSPKLPTAASSTKPSAQPKGVDPRKAALREQPEYGMTATITPKGASPTKTPSPKKPAKDDMWGGTR